MKKYMCYIITLLLVLIPISVDAKVDKEDVDYDVKALYVDASITDKGSMEVKELIVLDGDFNGYERELLVQNEKMTETEINFEQSTIYNPKGINLKKVAAKRLSQDINYDMLFLNYSEFKKVSYDDLGNSGTYNYYFKDNEHIIRTFNSCTNCTVGFYYEYEVEDVVVIHNDIAELYYQFIGDAFTDAIKEVEVHVNLPDIDDSEYFRVWAHGNLEGDIRKKENNIIVATISKLKANNTVDIRTTFNKSLIKDQSTLTKTKVDALDEILKVEETRAEAANKERKRIKIIYYTIQYTALIYFIILVVYTLYIVFKYDKEYKADFDHQYNREFIDDYGVEVIDYLMNKSISPNALSASIMNLVYKKNISVTELDKKNYSFKLENRDNLSKTEECLIDFLFNKIGKDDTFTIKELKDYAKSTKTYQKFTSSYEKWKNLVIVEGKNQKFYEDHTNTKVIGVLYAILGIVISFVSIFTIESFAWSSLIMVPAIIFMIYVIVFRKKTMKGINHYKRWKAFKNFLNDFGTFDTKELPEVILWERYLVYAVIFGLANKVQKVMNVKISELEADNVNIGTFNTTDFLIHYHLSSIINSSVSNAVNSAISTAAAQSSSSSGSGFGGGFSSGGGFGGGGGGGHGF